MSARSYFIAGTDTGIGKTRVTTALLAAGRAAGLKVAGMMSVASGQSSAYIELSPYCFQEAISPHIAAQSANICVDLARIVAISANLRAPHDLPLK